MRTANPQKTNAVPERRRRRRKKKREKRKKKGRKEKPTQVDVGNSCSNLLVVVVNFLGAGGG